MNGVTEEKNHFDMYKFNTNEQCNEQIELSSRSKIINQ